MCIRDSLPFEEAGRVAGKLVHHVHSAAFHIQQEVLHVIFKSVYQNSISFIVPTRMEKGG